MSRLTVTEQVVPGAEVAAVLGRVYRRLSSPERWSPDAWATLADGTPIRELAELHRAARVSVFGAIDVSTRDVALQEAACQALREAVDAAGVPCSLRRLGQRVGHGALLAMLQEAIALARSRPWRAVAPLVLPDRPPTLEEYQTLTHDRQVIADAFFASERRGGGQHDSTRTIAAARRTEQREIADYLDRHEGAIKLLLARRERKLTGRAARLARTVRHTALTLPRRASPRRGPDTPL